VTSDATQTETVATETEAIHEGIRVLIAQAQAVLWDFDGPVCRLFAGHAAEGVARGLVEWLGGRGPRGLLTEAERRTRDPHAVLRAVDRRHPGSALVAELEERLTLEELRAADSACPTPWADPLIRAWSAAGTRLAVATNNSPRVVRAYLARRGLGACFAPHIYGRTEELTRLKPDPHSLNRALDALDALPGQALMIGDTAADLRAAESAGVAFLGYARDAEKAGLLRAAGAATVVTSLEPVLAGVHAASGGPALTSP
jgi:HAD superfamily hydrolase (TIGR01549 family)